MRKPGHPRVDRGDLARSRRCCRPIRSPRPRCASSSPSSTGTWRSTARQLYGPAFFGGRALSESNLARIRKQLEEQHRRVQAAGEVLALCGGRHASRMADCSAFNNLPLIGMATKAAFGEDLLLAGGVDYKPYIKLVAQRPSAQRVVADRKVAQAKG